MKNSRPAHLLFILLCISLYSVSQTTVQIYPEKFREPAQNMDLSDLGKTFARTPWIVLSDRANNPTYTTRNSTTEMKIIDFLEWFFVIDVSNDRIRLAKANWEDFDARDVTLAKHEDYGWVDKNKMLLWHFCLRTERSKLTRKAMVLNSVEWASRVREGDQTDVVHFHKSPGLNNETGEKSQMFQIFHVFKFSEDGESMLLGKTSIITDIRNAKFDIVGWAPRNRLIFWDHRVAIEPNWIEEAAQERKNKGVRTTVFRDVSQAQSFNRGRSFDNENVLWDDDPYEVRRIGDYKRFPFYIKDANNILRCGVWGLPTTTQGDRMNLEEMSVVERLIGETTARRRNINIVFVIDGTESMKPYFEPVSRAIQASMVNLGETKNNIRFGAVVYRDYSEGEYLTERERLTPDYTRVANWLLRVFSDHKNRHDRDAPEAVFYGIREALRNIGLPADETNYLVLVGDAGNHKREDPSQVPREEIINLLIEMNINLMAFQVHNTGTAAYEDFHRDAKDLARTVALRRWREDEGLSKSIGLETPPVLKETSRNIFEMQQSALAAKVVQSPVGEDRISTELLQQYLRDFIEQAEQSTNEFLAVLNSLVEGGGFASISDAYKPALISILKHRGLSDAQIRFLTQSRFQFYTAGFTPIQPSGFNHPLFQEVILVTRMEFGGMIDYINKLVNVRSGSQARRMLQDTWLEILRTHTGEDFSNAMDMEMTEVTNILFGVPSTSQLLKEVRLIDIIDPNKFTDDALTRWMIEMQTKLTVLRNIQNRDNYRHSFRSNDEVYYWISQTNLP